LPVRSPRLNPFAFPSDTTLRFVLLVIFVICGSALLYGDLRGDARMDQVVGECISKVWSQINGIKTPNTSEDAEKIGALSGEILSQVANCSQTLRPRVWWSIGGIFLTITTAATIYWLYPIWILKAGRLKRLSTSELPEIDHELRDICRAADLPDPPIFVWNPIAAGLPLAFGRGDRYYVALSGSFISRFFFGDKSTFRAIVLHELAHIRNGDVSKTYLVISLWLAFITISAAPSLFFSLWLLTRSRLSDAVPITIYAGFWTVVVVLAGLAVLRAREYYADVRASVWEEVSHVDRALSALPASVGDGWRRFLRLHPAPADRREIVEDPSRLLRLSYFDAFGIGVAAWSVIDVLRGLMIPFLPEDKWEAFVYHGSLIVIMPAAVLLFAIGAIGIGVWRGAFASLLKGEHLYVRTGALGAALAAGVFPVFLLRLVSAVFEADTSQTVLLLTSFELDFLIAMILLAACFLVFRWIADATAAWLEVVVRSRSPQPILVTTIGTAFILVVIALALAFWFVYFSFLVTPWRGSPEWIFSYDTFLGGPVLLASVLVWAFPFAAAWWRNKVFPAGLGGWVFLDGSSPRLPRQEPLRLREALTIGVILGMIFWFLWEAEYFRIYLPVWLASTIDAGFSLLFNWTAGLFGGRQFLIPNSAMVFQALAAAIATGRAKRLSALCGLFAASVAGAVIVVGDWIFFSNAFEIPASEQIMGMLAIMGQGAIAALPTTIVTATISGAIRRAFSGSPGVQKGEVDTISMRVLGDPLSLAGIGRKRHGWAFAGFSFSKILVATLCVVVGIGMAARIRDEVLAVQQVDADLAAADRGDAAVQYKLGIMYARGQSAAQDDSQAVFWLRKAAEQGHTDAQYSLANMYASGRGVSKDDDLALQWLRRAADQGHPAAQDVLGAFYAQGRGTPRDDGAAVQWLRKSADQGYADAENNLAMMYQQGRALPKDDVRALEWFRKAAEHGHADAENNLGLMYASGRGTAKDDAAALQWFRRAAEQGHVAAQNNVGVFYALGRGTTRDDAAAVQWLRKAAEHGYANAQKELAIMYEQGRALPKDDALAMQWFRKAAEQGQAEAQFHIAEAYQKGEAVAKDDAQAVMWFRKAAENGYSEARGRLQAMCNTGPEAACSIE
jgi:TPR repeat protein/Zn-dependent protease with chaperone function